MQLNKEDAQFQTDVHLTNCSNLSESVSEIVVATSNAGVKIAGRHISVLRRRVSRKCIDFTAMKSHNMQIISKYSADVGILYVWRRCHGSQE